MKISVAWVFDHIDAKATSIPVDALVAKFNQATAEIEASRTVHLDLSNLFCAKVVNYTGQLVTVWVAELAQEVTLSYQSDVHVGSWYLIRIAADGATWATSVDLGGEKNMCLPAIAVTEEEARGSWRDQIETRDTILTVDNKSITHRPDLWGHRGFAREIAALFNLDLIPEKEILASKKIKEYPFACAADRLNPFSLSIKKSETCSRFAGLYLSKISYSPSSLALMSRLSKIDSRSINMLVDLTNYVMFDISQPMHVFDAATLQGNSLMVRDAHRDEKLTLLDGQTIMLSSKDMVIADDRHAVSLAGIMGGRDTGVTTATTSVFLESANFDAVTIRLTAQRHKIRSEASARFEKSLDPQQNVTALRRYLKLLRDYGIVHRSAGYIVSLGASIKPPVITVMHDFIQARLGVELSPHFVVDTLKKLQFSVKKKGQGSRTSYTITVPLFRATKDIATKEDIVEEIGRLYGYDRITPALPVLQTVPHVDKAQGTVYAIKRELAYGFGMRELSTYALFDESFLRTLAWDPGQTLSVKSPVSENWVRLVTTLIPALLKAVQDTSSSNDALRFFEWARVWPHIDDFSEKKVLAGVFFEKGKPFSFYDAKAVLEHLCAMLSLSVSYVHMTDQRYPWFDTAQSAHLIHDGHVIGVFGKLNEATTKIISGSGVIYAFELDGDFLEQYQAPHVRGIAIAKYPSIERDVSMLIALTATVAKITAAIKAVDNRIVSVSLRDFFQKKEWTDQKSLTFRYIIRDQYRTLTKENADGIQAGVTQTLEAMGAIIR